MLKHSHQPWTTLQDSFCNRCFEQKSAQYWLSDGATVSRSQPYNNLTRLNAVSHFFNKYISVVMMKWNGRSYLVQKYIYIGRVQLKRRGWDLWLKLQPATRGQSMCSIFIQKSMTVVGIIGKMYQRLGKIHWNAPLNWSNNSEMWRKFWCTGRTRQIKVNSRLMVT